MSKDNVLKIIREYFSDMKRTQKQTKEDLEEIRDTIEEYIEVLENDINKE